MIVEHMRPEHKKFLDDLRASGEINMFGARPYLENKFNFQLNKEKASNILKEWMNSYGEENIEYKDTIKEEHKQVEMITEMIISAEDVEDDN